MGITAAILGGIGGLCAVVGIVTALEVTTEPIISEHFTWMFWFVLSAILLLGSIALTTGRRQGGD
jgi:hypothetical protein